MRSACRDAVFDALKYWRKVNYLLTHARSLPSSFCFCTLFSSSISDSLPYFLMRQYDSPRSQSLLCLDSLAVQASALVVRYLPPAIVRAGLAHYSPL
jgi:hypothetical protein